MYQFQITVHARPAGVASAGSIDCEGQLIETLAVRPEMLSTPMGVSFEQAAESLSALARLYVEPDGSFVWVSPASEGAWQVDGQLYDRGGRLIFVDLKGSCPAAQFDQLLSTLGWPQTPLIFQLVLHALFLDEAEFRRFSAGTSAHRERV
jgi:hypothetical protein